MKYVKNMSTKSFKTLKDLRDCPVEVFMKIDGIPIIVDFIDDVFRIRTRRSVWIYNGNQFIEYSDKHPNTNNLRALNYAILFERLKQHSNVLKTQWEGKREPVSYEVLPKFMMKKDGDDLIMVKNKFPFSMFEHHDILLFDHERYIDAVKYQPIKILPCYKGVLQICYLLDECKNQVELHDKLKDLILKEFQHTDGFELEGYVINFVKIKEKYKVFI